MVLIFFLSSQPAPEAVKTVPIVSGIKIVHIVEYAILCSLFLFSLSKTCKIDILHICIIAATLTIVFGISDEVHQLFVPGRSGKLIDVFTDAIAAFISSGIYYIWNPFWFDYYKILL